MKIFQKAAENYWSFAAVILIKFRDFPVKIMLTKKLRVTFFDLNTL